MIYTGLYLNQAGFQVGFVVVLVLLVIWLEKSDSAEFRPNCDAKLGSQCFYVAVNGNDLNTGSINSPFETFHAALEQASAGDFVYARGGTYDINNAVIASLQRLPQQYFSGHVQRE